jgi:hypothetical protein
MKNKILYANGDSFIFGMEILEHDSRDERNKEWSFVKQVADKFGLKYVNNAFNGATNEFIFRQTMHDLQELEKTTDPSEVFVVIGWTSVYREEIIAKNAFDFFVGSGNNIDVCPDDVEYHKFGTFFINPHQSQDIQLIKNGYRKTFNLSQQAIEFCTMYFWDDEFQKQKLHALMLGLQGYLQSKGYRYLFVNCCNSDLPNVPCYGATQSFFEWGKQHHPKSLRQKNHFDLIAHTEYAKLITDYINQESLLQ